MLTNIRAAPSLEYLLAAVLVQVRARQTHHAKHHPNQIFVALPGQELFGKAAGILLPFFEELKNGEELMNMSMPGAVNVAHLEIFATLYPGRIDDVHQAVNLLEDLDHWLVFPDIMILLVAVVFDHLDHRLRWDLNSQKHSHLVV